MAGYVQTVLGAIAPEQMGFTLTHEHLLWDLQFYLSADVDPTDAADPRNGPLTMEHLGRLRYHLYEYKENLIQTEVAPAVRELAWFRAAGGQTICDCTSYGMGRCPQKIRQIARQSGVNVILGTGAYCADTLPPWLAAMDAAQMAALFVRELREGIDQTGIRCGFLGEIGVSEGLPPGDRRSLAAAAMAQRETGAALLIHQPGLERRADEIFRILTDNGGRLDKTVMCHCDPLLEDPGYLDHMAKSGATLSFDFFGLEIVMTLKGYENLWLPTDRQRIDAIAAQIARGNLRNLVMSHDTVYKSMWRQYGGFGYGHLPENMIPLMLAAGYEPSWIGQMTVENPRALFTLHDKEV